MVSRNFDETDAKPIGSGRVRELVGAWWAVVVACHRPWLRRPATNQGRISAAEKPIARQIHFGYPETAANPRTFPRESPAAAAQVSRDRTRVPLSIAVIGKVPDARSRELSPPRETGVISATTRGERSFACGVLLTWFEPSLCSATSLSDLTTRSERRLDAKLIAL